jgi:cytochrome c-type biogenesis protein CcsB
MTNTQLTILLAAVLGAAVPLRAETDFDTLRTIAVQDGGRTKPLDTFARETARRVSGAKPFTGGESVAGLDPVEWVVSMVADPEKWQDAVVVRVSHAGLREAVRLPEGRDRFSFRELAGHRPFMEAADAAHAKLAGGGKLDPIEQEVANLYETLTVMGGLFSGQSLRILPASTGDPGTAWLSLAELDQAPEGQRVRGLLVALTSAYRAGDREAVRVSAAALRTRLASLAPAAYPSSLDLAREVRYNTLKPFRLAWVAYLIAFLVLLASFPLRSARTSWVGLAFAVLGFAVHGYGMLLRILISARPPVTNMYESVIWVAWGAVLFALVFETVYRSRYFAACASGLAVVCLILADNVPILDGSIEPLVPVLRDNMWLTLHVLTITLGYAAFLLAMGIGHVYLGLYFLAPHRSALLKTMSMFLYRSLQVGTLLLAVGTLLGGVWASYSWGRFWGWDPKETWALIALLGYLAVLHGRFAGWFREFGMAVGSIVGFLLVLMAWYGVNFILGTGLHSYGFGAGGYAWIGGFVAFEALVIVAAFVRKHRGAPAPAAALAAPAVGVLLLAVLFGACASAPAPVRLEASPADLQALAGEWEGEYHSAATGRSGSVVFKLVAGEDHAHGDVVMMPSGSRRAYAPMRDAPGPVSPAELAQVLNIAFVRVASGGVLEGGPEAVAPGRPGRSGALPGGRTGSIVGPR